MLEHLRLKNVGPAAHMEIDFAPRLNLLTGDNGLGKSFLLDVAWWALTRKWPHDLNPRMTSGYAARPTDPAKPASIGFRIESKVKSVEYESPYVAQEEAWLGKAGRPGNPGLVIYAHSDGGFSVWDPARNYWKKRGHIDVQDRLPGFVLAPQDVWDGLTVDVDGKPTRVCKGLLEDWSIWIRENGQNAQRMATVLKQLSPDGEPITVGALQRMSLDDVRDIPSIHTSYGREVPILNASAGIRRVAGLAYMLMWSWDEHLRAATRIGLKRTNQVVMLFDEIENHLHPRWQRSILRSVLDLAGVLHKDASVQLIAATHSPLVLASAESWFDSKKDAWFDLDLEADKVVLRRRPFERRGDVSNWLTSVAFDLKAARSLESEQAIEAALNLLRAASPSKSEVNRVDKLLRDSLGETDRFWVRWTEFRRQRAGAGS